MASNSEYFDTMFTSNFKELSENELKMNDIEPNAFEIIIDYMYTSNVNITEQNVQVNLKLKNFNFIVLIFEVN